VEAEINILFSMGYTVKGIALECHTQCYTYKPVENNIFLGDGRPRHARARVRGVRGKGLSFPLMKQEKVVRLWRFG